MMNSFRKKSPVLPLLFCILAGCLVLHVFVENTLFLKMFAPLDSITTGSGSENTEEFGHLDDLVQAGSSPVNIAGDQGPTAFPWPALHSEQVLLSIFKPPKI